MNMQTIIKIIGIVIIIMSVIYLLKPAVPRALIKFFKQGNWIYLAGLIRLVLAILFFMAANQCRKTAAIVFFGVLFLISAMLIFSVPITKMRKYMSWWQGQSDIVLRIASLLGLAIGTAIVYFA
jgi:hypothetical protein